MPVKDVRWRWSVVGVVVRAATYRAASYQAASCIAHIIIIVTYRHCLWRQNLASDSGDGQT